MKLSRAIRLAANWSEERGRSLHDGEALGISDDGHAMRSIHETVREKTKRWREHPAKGV